MIPCVHEQGWSHVVGILWLVPALMLVGCSSKPPRVRTIKIDAAAAAQQAMDEYDKDLDGELSADELVQSASIRKSRSRIDTDGNGSVSLDELRQRLLKWTDQKMGIRSLKVVISINGQPLADADVHFVPEPFMGDMAKPAYGFTNQKGVANMTHDADDMPPGAAGARGVTNGFFRIEIRHASQDIPAKYNDETVLGQEVAIDTIQSTLRIELSSRG